MNPIANHTTEKGSSRPPRVTIGIPVYNGERFISQAIDSALAQTYTDFEIIVSDNASTDRTCEIVQEYAGKDKRIKYSRNAKNLGAAGNYNRALDLASGEYFKWLADDDLVRPEFLEVAVNILDQDPSLVLAYSKAAFIDELNIVKYRFDEVLLLKPWASEAAPRTRQMLDAVFLNGRTANVIIFGLARTAALRTIRPLGNYFGCDFIVVTELALSGGIFEIPQTLSFFRRHQRSSSSYKRSPSAVNQQQFMDPTVTSRLKSELQLRRRYIEIFRSISSSTLSAGQKTHTSLAMLGFILRRVGWRIGFEIGSLFGLSTKSPGIEEKTLNLHWKELG